MKLKLTPELFILQDVCPQSNHTDRPGEDEEKTEAILLKNPIDLEQRLKQINRTKRFVEAPEFRLLNGDTSTRDASSPFKVHNDQLYECNPPNRTIELNQSKRPPNGQQRKPSGQPPSLANYLPHLHHSLEPNRNRIPSDKRLLKRRPTRDIIQSDIRCVTLTKDRSGFGLTIKGGVEFNKPLVIAALQRGSPADKCRSLFAGDLIVQLNGQPTHPLRLTHEQAMKTIKAGGNRLYLTVKHLTMYNRPIGRMWHRQLNTFWLNECDNKAEVVDWLGAPRTSGLIDPTKLDSQVPFAAPFSSNKSSSQESYTIPTPLSSSNPEQLSDSERYSNCGTTTLSLTVTDKDKDEPLLTPSPHDEGVYTGLSNDALSSSECTSDASGFSSDYTQSKPPSTDHRNSSANQNSSSYLQQHGPSNETDCSFTACSTSCKNRKNNNCCTKCIVNKNHATHPLHHVNSSSSAEQRSDDRPDCQTISQERFTFKMPAAVSTDKQNHAGFAFRSTADRAGEHSCCEQKRADLNNGQSDGQSAFQRLQQTNGLAGSSSCSCSLSSSSASRNSNRASLVDIVSVSLINCHFTKYISNTDSLRRNGMEVQWFNVHNQGTSQSGVKRRSADVSSAVISFNDPDLAQQFQSKINHYLSKLNESYMFAFSRGLRPQERILFMGWVSLALPKSTTNAANLKHGQLLASSLDYKWQPKYMIIRGGELLLYDCVPDYLLDKLKQVPYANDTLIEFNELSRLLVKPNGALACSITLNGGTNLNRPKSGNRKSSRLTRHLSIRGRDSTLDASHRFHVNDPKVLTETTSNNKRTAANGNRLISTLTRNLSLKTAKENRYNKQPANKARPTNPHCTLPRGQRIDQLGASSQLLERNLKRTGAESNLLRANDSDLLNQDNGQPFADSANGQPPEVEWENRPIVFKAYQSVLRQLKPEEQLDKRENCLLALTTQSDCVANATSMSTFGKHGSINRSTGELQENSPPNAWYGARKNSLDEQRQAASSASVVAYLSVEHAENIPQILKSWNVCTMHSVVQLSVSAGRGFLYSIRPN